MPKRAQGSFEYVLLLGGILLVVVLAVVVLRGGVLNPANQQIAGNLNTLGQVTSGCQALSTLTIDPTGSNATLLLCMLVNGSQTAVYLYSNPIVFNGFSDQPYNMTFSTVNGVSVIFLNVTGKNGTTLNMSQTHCVDVTVGGVYILRQLCGSIGATTGGPTPTPTPPPAPQVVLNSPADGGTAPNGTTFQFTPTSAAAFSSATLYGNFTGVFSANVSNSSTIVNNSINSLVTAVPPGSYLWNVQVCDKFANCSSAPANFTFKAQYNNTWMQTTQADFAAGAMVNINLSAQPGDVVLNQSYSWTNVAPVSSPPARYDYSMAFDSSRNLAVLFGGWNGSLLGDTWVYNASSNTWTKVTPAASPTARQSPAMAFDSSRNLTVLFGGTNGSFLSDTWVFNASSGNWTQVFPAVSPSARYSSEVVFDSSRNLTVLFGGFNISLLGDTWVFNASSGNWTQVFPAVSPSARYYHAMAFDSSSNLTVLFGGATGAYLADTWVFNGTNWAQVFPAVSPPARSDHPMAFDSSRNLTVLFGGWNGVLLGDTWVFNGTNWARVFPTASPSARYDPSMVFDSSRNITVLFGGYNGAAAGDTWTLSKVYPSAGVLSSAVFDAGQNASWFALNWSQSLLAGTNVSLQTRTCTSALCADNPTYSAGLSCAGSLCSSAIPSTSGRRYIQWQANLTTANALNTPVLSEVNASYGIP